MKKNTAKVTRRGLLQAGAGLALVGTLADTAAATAHDLKRDKSGDGLAAHDASVFGDEA